MLLHYIKNPKRTGALCSSSKQLSHIITENIGIENASNIIEIGPGLGAFTRCIINKKKKDSKFFAVEINENIAKNLCKKFKNLDVEVGSAEFLESMMKRRNMKYADVIVSGIPWALLSKVEQDRILHSIYKALKPGGYFVTFAYVIPTLYARYFKKKVFCTFNNVKTSSIIWNNIPPAFVYFCKK